MQRKLENGTREKLIKERNKLLRTIIRISDVPLIILGFVWLGLLIIELLNKSTDLLQTLGVVIWIIFIIDFVLKFIISTSKALFLKKNILTIISLIVPAFRLFRVFRIIRLLRFNRGLRLVKMVGSFNRGMKSLAFFMKKRALGFVLLLSVIGVLIGAAGLHAFEKDINPGFEDYGSAVWWTAMLTMSMGTENWPISAEGRVLCFLIAIYGLAVFGYVTASIATFFIGKDAENKASDSESNQIEELKREINILHNELKRLNDSRYLNP